MYSSLIIDKQPTKPVSIKQNPNEILEADFEWKLRKHQCTLILTLSRNTNTEGR